MPPKPPYQPDPEMDRTHPHLKDFFPFMHELRYESDRGAVLLCCAYLDDLLRDILSAFFLETPETARLLEGYNAPLGTFSARVSAAHAMALVSKAEFDELTRLRKVRNEFAHSKTASFSDQKIGDLCSNLKYCVQDLPGKPPVVSKHQFNTAAVALIATLTNRAHYVAQDRRQPQRFPR